MNHFLIASMISYAFEDGAYLSDIPLNNITQLPKTNQVLSTNLMDAGHTFDFASSSINLVPDSKS